MKNNNYFQNIYIMPRFDIALDDTNFIVSFLGSQVDEIFFFKNMVLKTTS